MFWITWVPPRPPPETHATAFAMLGAEAVLQAFLRSPRNHRSEAPAEHTVAENVGLSGGLSGRQGRPWAGAELSFAAQPSPLA